MPRSIQDWILESPNATADFADFFEKAGKIEEKEDVKFALYAPGQPPKIYVNEAQWKAVLKKDAPESQQRELFGTLSHEIGHDRFNTATVPFKGTTAEEYVQYRSELEANAIFNAFPIFKDLENTPAFKYKPFAAIGYLHEFDLGQMYGQWRRGELDDQTAVDRMARKVPDAPYTLGDPPQDMNRDGALTHRDKYLQDFEQYMKPRLALQPGYSTGLDEPDYSDRRVTPPAPSTPQQTGAQAREYHFFPRTPEDDYLDAYWLRWNAKTIPLEVNLLGSTSNCPTFRPNSSRRARRWKPSGKGFWRSSYARSGNSNGGCSKSSNARTASDSAANHLETFAWTCTNYSERRVC